MGVKTIHASGGEARIDVTVVKDTTNAAGLFHGGVIYTLCDMACYAALLSLLKDGENAATHDIHVSVLRAGKSGDQVRVTGKVIKHGRSVAFMEAQAHSGDQLLARATVTKSILRSGGGKP
jgi:uncharacterized protein (TIGR00369 family)